jgi:hypothetical protein
MKGPRILCAILVCTWLAWETAAAALPVRPDGASGPAARSPNEVGSNQAEPSPIRETARNRATTGENTSKKSERADDSQSKRVGSDSSVGSTGGNPGAAASHGRGSAAPQRRVGQLATPNADRLRSLLSARARGRPAQPASRRSAGPIRPRTGGGAAARGPGGAGEATRPTPAASRPAAVASGPTTVASRPTGVASGPTPVGSNIATRALTSPSAVTRAFGRGSTIGGPRAPGPGLVGGPAIGRTAHNATIDGSQLHHPH